MEPIQALRAMLTLEPTTPVPASLLLKPIVTVRATLAVRTKTALPAGNTNALPAVRSKRLAKG